MLQQCEHRSAVGEGGHSRAATSLGDSEGTRWEHPESEHEYPPLDGSTCAKIDSYRNAGEFT